MARKKIDERICRDCGNPIIGRRIDAIVCKECQDQGRRDSSKRKHRRDSEEKLLKKIRGSNVKREIEREKVVKILEGLKREIDKKPEISKEEIFNTFQYNPSEIAGALGFNTGFGFSRKKFEEQDLGDIKDFIKERIEEEKEKIKKEFEEKKREELPGFLSFS